MHSVGDGDFECGKEFPGSLTISCSAFKLLMKILMIADKFLLVPVSSFEASVNWSSKKDSLTS